MSGNFRKGSDAAQEASKGGGSFAKTHYFSLDGNPTSPDNSALVRFITDEPEWIVVDQHANIPTKPQPKDWPDGAKWPQKMGAVCRKDPAFEGIHADCYICDHIVDGKVIKKPSARTWALACLREEVIENGQVVGVRDKTREITKVDKDGKPTGETTTEKAIVVVNMGFKNFFSALKGFAGYYKTVLDRDYLIKRNGTDETTTYNIIPMDPIQMQDGRKFDLRNEDHMARYASDIDLEEIVSERASDEFYARFFDKRVESPPMKSKGDGAAATATEQPKPDNDATSERMAALADRVKGYSPSGETAAATPTAPPATEQPVAAAAGMKDFG